MAHEHHDYVFLMDCADFSEAQVVRSFLISQGFNPRVRDEQTRGVAPHFGQLLGKLTLEIPEYQYMAASQALEKAERAPLQIAEDPKDMAQDHIKFMATRAVWNAILGIFILPLVCNLYSMLLSFRVLRAEFPIAKENRKRLVWAAIFNSIAFYLWLAIAPKYFFHK